MCSASISAVCLRSAVHLTPTIDFTHPYLREIRRNLEHNELDFFSRSVLDNAASRNSVTAVAREMQRKGAEAIGAFFSPQPRAEWPEWESKASPASQFNRCGSILVFKIEPSVLADVAQ